MSSRNKQPRRAKEELFQKRTLPNGEPNPNYEDALKSWPPAEGSEWGVYSFLSPEEILKKKEIFYFESFLRTWNFAKPLEVYRQFTMFIAHKYNLVMADVAADFDEFYKAEEESIRTFDSLLGDYKTFIEKHGEDLQKKFSATNFQTNIRSFRCMGAFPTQKEAEDYAEFHRERENGIHNLTVGQNGYWLAWDPSELDIGKVIYAEEEMNQLYKEKMKNDTKAKALFDQRVKDSKIKAINENKTNAEKYGIKLTQDIDE